MILWKNISKFFNKSFLLSLKAPTISILDTFYYYFYFLLVIIYAIPIAIITQTDFASSIHSTFPKILNRDLIIKLNGVKFYIRMKTADIVLLNKISEPWMIQYFSPRTGDVIVDIGAHVGKFSLLSAKLIGESGKVIAIEPIPENFNGLLKNIQLNGFQNIVPINVAAYNENKNSVVMSGSRDDNYSIGYSPNIGNTEFQVNVKTVDSIIDELGIDTIDYVKMDVEGAELEVLEGMKGLIENNRVKNCFIEFHMSNQDEVNEILAHFSRRSLQGDEHGKHSIIHYWKG